LAILDVPDDFVAYLDEPLNAVVAVKNGQQMLLGGPAVRAFLTVRHHRRHPRNVGSGSISEHVKRMNLVFKTRFGMNFGGVLRHIEELAVDRLAALARAPSPVAGA